MARLPAWSTAYALFRFADGVAAAAIPLAVVFRYHMPLWALAATVVAMNAAAVPAAAWWGRLMERGRGRRRLAVGGFAVAGLAAVAMGAAIPFPAFVAAAVAYNVAASATGPAAGVLAMEGQERHAWPARMARLGAVTGWPHVAGVAIAAALGLTGRLDLEAVFLAAAVIAAGSALLARWLVPAWSGPAPSLQPRLAEIEASQPRMERTVYRPGRLRIWPDLGALRAGMSRPYRLWTGGIVMLFVGALMVYALLPGVLATRLGYGPGMVLMVQLPSQLAAPLSYGLAARRGARWGEGATVVRAALVRSIGLGALVAAIVADAPWTFALLMMAQATIGMTFAWIQVNGGCLLARIHPEGRGAGVGAFHAAVGAGVVLGSMAALSLLFVIDVFWVYAAALLVTAGAAGLLRAAWSRTFPADRGEA